MIVVKPRPGRAMKLFIETDGVTVEIEDKAVVYQPDVLDDWARRAGEMVREQRALSVVLDSEPPATL